MIKGYFLPESKSSGKTNTPRPGYPSAPANVCHFARPRVRPRRAGLRSYTSRDVPVAKLMEIKRGGSSGPSVATTIDCFTMGTEVSGNEGKRLMLYSLP